MHFYQIMTFLDFYRKIKDDEFIKKLNYHNLSNE